MCSQVNTSRCDFGTLRNKTEHKVWTHCIATVVLNVIKGCQGKKLFYVLKCGHGLRETPVFLYSVGVYSTTTTTTTAVAALNSYPGSHLGI